MLVIAEEAALTDTGRQRQANEDAYVARPPVFAVADGMGGARGGEVASRIATEALEPEIDEQVSAEEALHRVIAKANRAINQIASQDEAHSGMGTTLTAAVVGENEVSVAHVGDSRAYLFRNGELSRLTRDHSLVEELKRQGQLTEEEAESHPQRSIITRALGPEPDVEIDTHSHFARDGDTFLLCSDGLTTMVSDDEIGEVLSAEPDLKSATRKLVDLANEHGGRDNITIVAFRLAEVALDLGGEAAGETLAGETLAGAGAKQVGDELRAATARAAVAPQADKEKTVIVRDGEVGEAAQLAEPAVAERTPAPRKRRSRRRLAVVLVVLAVLAAAAAGATIGMRQVYFIGTNGQGLVSVYRGLPYELPAGIALYTDFYTSSAPAAKLDPLQRQRLLDHRLRSKRDAEDLVRQLERGKLET